MVRCAFAHCWATGWRLPVTITVMVSRQRGRASTQRRDASEFGFSGSDQAR
jgi:hypothetical protein